MIISLICTLKNEEVGLKRFLDSVLSQTLLPDEFIVVDGGSEDRTLEILHQYAVDFDWVRIIAEKDVNVPRGRNIAISASKGDIIASTDAGCVLDPFWLERIVAPLQSGDADVVGGGYELDYKTKFQRCLAAVVSSDMGSWDKNTFLPSSRSIAFLKTAWDRVGGYPEFLPVGEDSHFDLRLREAGQRFELERSAIVRWEVRPNVRSLARQYYRYHMWDMIAGNFLHRFMITLMMIAVSMGIILISLMTDIRLLGLATGIILIFGFVRYGLLIAIREGCPYCIIYSPIVAATILLSENVGRLVGICKRAFNRIMGRDLTHRLA